MRRVAAVIAGVVVLLDLGATPASATSNVVYHTVTNWGRIVDGPRGQNTLVYACDGQNDGFPVGTEALTFNRRTGERHNLMVVDDGGPNNGRRGGATVEVFDACTYAYELRVCEIQAGSLYCTDWYPTSWSASTSPTSTPCAPPCSRTRTRANRTRRARSNRRGCSASSSTTSPPRSARCATSSSTTPRSSRRWPVTPTPRRSTSNWR